MTQRSVKRWNAGKRGARQRRAQKAGIETAKRNGLVRWPGWEVQEVIKEASETVFPCYPTLRSAFRDGAWKWAESQPVEF